MNISTDDILKNLTEDQLSAVTHLDGPMLVVAGAGSGKTRVVTRRIAYLISQRIWPSQILAMTFTNRAAREMQERIGRLVGEVPRNVGTFHSCCARFLRQYIEALDDGRTKDYIIFDTDDQKALIKQCLNDHPVTAGLSPGIIAELISRAKSACLTPQEIMTKEAWDNAEAILEVCQAYENRLRAQNAVDFDDLLLLVARLLRERPAIREIIHNHFRYLLVDEYQDTNHLQYELLKLLVNPATNNIHATGDPDQCIYSWRGADYSNIMNFEKDFPNAVIIRLEKNFRSSEHILNAASSLISNNLNRIDKTLIPAAPTENPQKVRLVTVGSDRDEGLWIARRIRTLYLNGNPYRTMAVFYRTNRQSRALEEALVRAGIPYQIIGGLRFYARREIKDLLAFLRLKVNPADRISLERVAAYRGGVGPKTLAAIEQCAREHGMESFTLLCQPDFAQRWKKKGAKVLDFANWCRQLNDLPCTPVGHAVAAVHDFADFTHHAYDREGPPEARLENLQEMITNAILYEREHEEAGLNEFLQDIALVADVDAHDPDRDTVVLMTLHCAKGLEFPYVFIAGVEEDYLPHANTVADPDQIEEERRLFFVGITRGREEVALLNARARASWDGGWERQPSRFIRELPMEDIVRTNFNLNNPTMPRRQTFRRW